MSGQPGRVLASVHLVAALRCTSCGTLPHHDATSRAFCRIVHPGRGAARKAPEGSAGLLSGRDFQLIKVCGEDQDRPAIRSQVGGRSLSFH